MAGKIRLNLNELQVETFSTTMGAAERRGTVHGHSDADSTSFCGPYYSWDGGADCHTYNQGTETCYFCEGEYTGFTCYCRERCPSGGRESCVENHETWGECDHTQSYFQGCDTVSIC